MAYMDQTKKKTLAPMIKAVLKKYDIKGSISVRDHSTLVVNIKSGALDIIGDYNSIVRANPDFSSPIGPREASDSLQINQYHLNRSHSGKSLEFLKELDKAMNDGNFDKSDSQSDFFCIGWYSDINIGKWDKPYLYDC